jgi:hypothetical protein
MQEYIHVGRVICFKYRQQKLAFHLNASEQSLIVTPFFYTYAPA